MKLRAVKQKMKILRCPIGIVTLREPIESSKNVLWKMITDILRIFNETIPEIHKYKVFKYNKKIYGLYTKE